MSYAELTRTLYHGSDARFNEIDLMQSVPYKDFGRGFYTTNDQSQAEKFARLKAARTNAEKGLVYVFQFAARGELNIQKFAAANEEWFDFVLSNRGYADLAAESTNPVCDIVIGPVANDAVGLVLNQFIAGTYGDPRHADAKDIAIQLLLSQRLHNQVLFATERAVAGLVREGVYDVCLD